MQIEHKEINFLKAFDVKEDDIEDGKSYLVYMLYDNFNEYKV